jgi:hypothetical protein
MANTLTNLAADIYKAADVVGRELVGVIPSVTVNGDASTRAAKGDNIRSHFTRTPTVSSSYAPSMTIPEGTDQTVDNKTLVVDTFASVQIPWTGEDIKHVNNGSGFETIYGDQIQQAFRAINNTIESYLWGIGRAGASRAYGTAGTTPFGSNFNEVAEMRQILVDNGMPADDRMSTLVLNTLAGTKLRNLAQLQKANENGSDQLLRQGTLLDLQGLMLKESAAPVSVTAGTGASYTSNNAGYAVGATSITLITGTGTILAGDTVTFAGDTNKYVVATGVAAPGVLVLAEPGLRKALAASAVALTVGAAATANLAFHKSAIELVVRPVAVPDGGDAATDVMTVQDPFSGLVYDISMYKGYKKAMIEVSCLYGGKVWKPQHVAQLLG